jgi:hypothetical protein
MDKDNIIKQFAAVGLKAELSKAPFVRGINMEDIFQMDIRREIAGVARSEYFLIWPGAEDNIFHVAAKDKEHSQLVVTIKEPQRDFWERLNEFEQREIKKLGIKVWLDKRGRGTTIAKKKDEARVGELWDFGPDGWYQKNRTPRDIRHFLLGKDERQLFMCRLPKAATSVKEARESLKAPEVITAEGKSPGKTLRQGEWFLLNMTKDEEANVKNYLKSSLAVIHKKANVGQFAGRRGGKPHIVDELITISAPVLSHGFSVQGRPNVFIRGHLKHPDHETIKLGKWRKVILNAERTAAAERGGGAFFGGTWID